MEKKIFSVRLPHKLLNLLSFDKQVKRIVKKLPNLEDLIQPTTELSNNLRSLVLIDNNIEENFTSLACIGELACKNRQVDLLISSTQRPLLEKYNLKANFIEIPEQKGIGDPEIKALETKLKESHYDIFWNFSKKAHPLDLYLACLSKTNLRIGFDLDSNKSFINFRIIGKSPCPKLLKSWFKNDFNHDFYWQYNPNNTPISKGHEVLIPYKSNLIPHTLNKTLTLLKERRTPLKFLEQTSFDQDDFRRCNFLLAEASNLEAQKVAQLGLCPVILLGVNSKHEKGTYFEGSSEEINKIIIEANL